MKLTGNELVGGVGGDHQNTKCLPIVSTYSVDIKNSKIKYCPWSSKLILK